MARLFITQFSLGENLHTAFVSVSNCKGSQIVSVLLPDASLHRLLPGGVFSFDPRKGPVVEHSSPQETQELLRSILTAIEQHDSSLVVMPTNRS